MFGSEINKVTLPESNVTSNSFFQQPTLVKSNNCFLSETENEYMYKKKYMGLPYQDTFIIT